MDYPPMWLRPSKYISLTTTDPGLPSLAWKLSDVCNSRSSQLVPRNPTLKSFLCVSLCLAVWVCLKQGSENMVLVVLRQIGAKDLTVLPPSWAYPLF